MKDTAVDICGRNLGSNLTMVGVNLTLQLLVTSKVAIELNNPQLRILPVIEL